MSQRIRSAESGERRLELEPLRVAGDERRRRAVAELQHREQFLDFTGVLQVERA